MNQVLDRSPIIKSEESFWQAVQARDERFNGVFVYAVHSTGIYCKPTCPARRPRRQQVAFFSSCDTAEAAGFRACRRCQPRLALSQDQQVELIQRACRLIDANIEQPPALGALSQQLNLSSSYLHRLFKSVTGLTPHQYAAGQRLKKFKSKVKAGDDLTTAMYAAGYGSSSRLYEKAPGSLGMTPASYRRGGQGMEIHYTIVDSYLGRMLVAATRQGICAVSFGKADAELEVFLRAEYPAAVLERDDTFLKSWVDALVEHLAGTRPHLELPLDLQATAFQLRVWEELRKIPYGETRTYTEVAQAIGRPRAVRAVANACGANPAVIVTPCHRVVRRDGALGGYRWGVERKKALLKHEQG
jgi:AraC family transcriptional regulator of adaptative response/methylated-DNA-[protein]-cysteine methyltransferase